MLKESENKVKIEGILSEVDLAPKTFNKNGQTVDAIGGVIKVRVNQKIDGKDTELEIPIHMFAAKFTNAGAPNPAYESISRIQNEYTSIAAGGIDRADRVRITNAKIAMNEYYGQNGNLISFPRITASFVNKIRKDECKPEAKFTANIVIGKMAYETDADGVETDTFKIVGFLPQFGGKVDVVPFYTRSKNVIDGISGFWKEGDTVTAIGKLNFTSRTETTTVEVAFGEPTEKTRTITVSELLITGGSDPLDGEFAIDNDEIKNALAERKSRLDALKDRGAKAPAQKPASSKFADLGF